MYLGDWEGGLLRKKAAENDPVYVRMKAEQRWDIIPGGEPPDRLHTRVRRGIERIGRENPDGRVVAVVHGGVIGTVLALASGSTPMAFVGADNGSISILVVSAEGWVVRGFNDTTHLR